MPSRNFYAEKIFEAISFEITLLSFFVAILHFNIFIIVRLHHIFEMNEILLADKIKEKNNVYSS